ncbi:18356_t:CDS:2 [Gigaspora rosea]|nr:18356_t:CDS:2 [Gigaspora rosea]
MWLFPTLVVLSGIVYACNPDDYDSNDSTRISNVTEASDKDIPNASDANNVVEVSVPNASDVKFIQMLVTIFQFYSGL